MKQLNSLNIEHLKSESLYSSNGLLRFPIVYLSIQRRGQEIELKDLSGTYKTSRGTSKKIRLNDILFDTGNQVDYCLLSAHYFENFKQLLKLQNSDFKIIHGKSRKNITKNYVSNDFFKFRFSDRFEFYSRIGFLTTIASDWIFTINIGITLP